jgi:hypothetical protein
MRFLAVGLLLTVSASLVVAQTDPGVPDTVRLGDVALSGNQAVVPVSLVNDEPLSGFQIPLHFSTDLVNLDSVVFGARTAGFAGADIVRSEVNLNGTVRTVMLAVVPLETGVIPSGNDPVAELYFSRNSGTSAATAVVNDTSLLPAGGLLLADTSAFPVGYRPIFRSGVVRDTSGCGGVLLGDVNCDSLVDLTDVVFLGNVIDGLVDSTGACFECAGDTDGDGLVATQADYVSLYNSVSHLEP